MNEPSASLDPPAGVPGPDVDVAPTAEAVADRPFRPFLILWTGQALSLLGSAAVTFALIWWLTQRTGSATILATATLLGLLPQVVLGPIIGTFVDRWNRKTILLCADCFVAIASLGLAALFVLGVADTGHVLAFLFARALGSAFHEPAMLASTSLLVSASRLTRIQGMNQALEGLLNVVAAPLGALLISLLPMTAILMVDVGTALFAIAPLLRIRIPQPEQAGERPSFRRELADGFRYLWSRPGHRKLVLLSAAINLFLVPAFALLPLFVLQRLHGDAAALGWLTSAFGVGLLAGGLLLGVWGGFRKRIFTTLAALVALGVVVVGLGLTPEGSFAVALAAMGATGVVVPLANGPVLAILQATVAPHFQGRVFTLIGSLAGGTAPVGLLLATPIAEVAGPGAFYFVGGAICAAMGIVGFFSSDLVRIEEGPSGEEESPAGSAPASLDAFGTSPS
jgi:DHA3 family macrolide efflux protein-like MFS transporter